MANSLFIAATEPQSGKSLVVLGVMELLSRHLHRLGFFRPMIAQRGKPDADIELVRRRYLQNAKAEALYALDQEEAASLVASGRGGELMERIFSAYKRIEETSAFVVCEGTDFTGVSSSYELEFTAQAASHLGSPVLVVTSGRRKTRRQIVGAALAARELFVDHGATVVAIIVNRVDPARLDAVRDFIATEMACQEPVYVIPEHDSLGKPTVREVAEALDARVVFPALRNLNREVRDFQVAAMRPSDYLVKLREGSMIITPGDRDDIVLASLAAAHAKGQPSISGLVLTGGLDLSASVLAVLEGTRSPRIPIFGVDSDTYDTAMAVSAVRAAIRPDNQRKIASALGVFEAHVDVTELETRIEVARSHRVTPMMFEYELVRRARSDKRHIVLPEGTDKRILRATDILLRRGIVDITLLGDEQTIHRRASSLGFDVGRARIIDPASFPDLDDYAATYFELRRHKGITEDVARDVVQDLSFFGTMMVYKGHADGMVSGAMHTTGHTIRPALEFIRTEPGFSIVSSVFFMCLEDRVLVYGDCAVNPNPSAEQLAEIALSSALTAEQFGIEPRVAMLSYSTGASGAGADVERVREATRLARERRPELAIEGPIQYDAAVDAEVAQLKMPESEVAGRATVFIFPDLNTGNNTYKAVQRSANAVAVGPVLQGLKKPVNDLSRGCTVADIVNTVAITAIQAQRPTD